MSWKDVHYERSFTADRCLLPSGVTESSQHLGTSMRNQHTPWRKSTLIASTICVYIPSSSGYQVSWNTITFLERINNLVCCVMHLFHRQYQLSSPRLGLVRLVRFGLGLVPAVTYFSCVCVCVCVCGV